MDKEIVLKKVLLTTLSMFIILTIFTIPTIINSNVLRTNLEIEDISSINTNKVYLLNKDNLFVQVDLFLDYKDMDDQIKKIISYLTVSNTETPVGLNGFIPKNTKLLNIKKDKDIIYLDFSKELLSNNIDYTITGIVYSLLEIDTIKKISITVNNDYVKGYEGLLDKSIGINKSYLYNSRMNLCKVVIYYLNTVNDNNYYVPVTKYLNDKREKIEIIIDELKQSTFSSNLISTMNPQVVLLDYKEDNNVLFLNFNDLLLDSSSDDNSIIDVISYSVFDNYDVNMVVFEVNGTMVDSIKKVKST